MPRLRRVDCAALAISRRRRGKGFEYLDESLGERIDDEEIIERIRTLAIPPRLAGRLDLRRPARAHPGHGHRR